MQDVRIDQLVKLETKSLARAVELAGLGQDKAAARKLRVAREAYLMRAALLGWPPYQGSGVRP